MKRLVFNMVCRENHNSPDSGRSLMRVKPSDKLFIHPLFLREVGKYYWNFKHTYSEYGICGADECVKNGYLKMFRFFDTDDLFFSGCRKGDLKVIKYLIEKGADAHADNDWGLVEASLNGHLKVVKYLVENRANIHSRCNSALHYASEKGHLKVVKYLVAHGANIHADHDEALRLASMYGHFQVVKYLVENGADVHAQNDQALEWAYREGHSQIAQFLVENGAMLVTKLKKYKNNRY